jgi:phosphoglycolate phosphatase-like HAD superfamily hydrolase
MTIRHVVWDWNGTLLADQWAVLGALNVLVEQLGRPPVDMATYRALYTRPVRVFYERLLDRAIDDQTWDHIDEVFHRAYFDLVHRAPLDPDARPAMRHVAASGRTQSLLSMARHDHLLEMVAHHDIDHHFERVDGVRGVGGGHKEAWLRAHLDALSVASADEVLVVGDALDDAVAATAVGAPVVLFDGGSHPVEVLHEAGVPVVDSLAAAVRMAGSERVG